MYNASDFGAWDMGGYSKSFGNLRGGYRAWDFGASENDGSVRRSA